MKFTKEQAFESLKRELTNNGKKTLRMSLKSLDKLTDTLISKFADDEIGLPEFCTEALTVLNVVNDNVGKDRSDFIKEWEKNHEDGEPNPNNPNPEQKPNDNPDIAALKAEIEELKKANAESAKKATIAQRRKDMVAKLKEKGVKDDKWIDKLLSKVNLDRDFEVDAEVDDLLPLYNAAKANGGNSVPPGNPSGSANSSALNSIKAAAELAKKERAIIENKQ